MRAKLWALRYGAAALPIALMAIYAKVRWLELGAFRIVARSIGRAGVADLSWSEKLSFLRGDLLVGAVALPLLIAAVMLLVRPRWRLAVTCAVVAVVALAFYIQVRAQSSVGTFLHVRLFISAIRFSRERPDLAGSYVSLGGLVKLGAAVLAAAVLAWWAARRDPARPGAGPAGRLERAAGPAAAGLVALVTAAAWLARVPATPVHGSMLAQAVTAYWGRAGQDDAAFAGLGPAELAAEYRAIAGVPVSPRDTARWGSARGFDLLMFVMETVPTACVDFTGDLAGLPTAQRLRRSAIVAAGQRTVYPYSSLANFTMLTGWYPPEFARSYMQRHTRHRVPSLLWELRAQGYRTAMFEPFPALFEDDPTMFRILGVEEQVVPGIPPASGHWDWREIVEQDGIAAERLLALLETWLTAGQRYAVVYAPQMSHAPWRDPVPGRDTTDLLARCRSLVAVQDSALGRLVAVIERHRRLDRTIILLTADHGVRTKEEDPRFEPGVLDDYSFHVPLMIAVPGIMDSTLTVPWLTSAVDVSPTILDLVGVERDRSLEQGNTLWDPRVADRTTFVLARQLFGVTGYHRQGRFHQWNEMTGAVCASEGRLHCGAAGHVGGDSASAAVRTLLRFQALQRAWLERNVVRPR